ncbi:DUF5926 family protein [Nocardioides montaniterrae]
MAKRDRNQPKPLAPGEVGPRQPCPCGSGKRYKACHGAPGGAQLFVKRPFEGLASECDVVAMRELVPAATAPITVKGHEDREVRLCTLLPMAAPAMVRDSGAIWLGLQVQHAYGDPARDLGAVLEQALTAEPGVVSLAGAPGEGARIQDLIADTSLDITVHEGFGFWVEDMESSAEVAAAIEAADGAASPTVRLTGVTAAYWTAMGSKEHLRWVMPEPEDTLLSALARLHGRGDDVIVEGARFVGMFRAHGLLAPVWDLPVGTGAEALEAPAAEFKAKLDAALAELEAGELTTEERSARNGLANRQVTIR